LEAARALDTDGSGKVELNEIISFARSHGLDIGAVQSEFASFDKDQDGTLDISELNDTLAVKENPRPTAEKVTLRTRSQPGKDEVASQMDARSIPQSISPAHSQSMIKVHHQNVESHRHVEQQARGTAPAPASAMQPAVSQAEVPAPAPAPIPAGAESASADMTAAQSMIKALDTDGSGVVEKSEVDAFAKSQGLSAAETAEEFKDLDKNHDGQLDSSEISSTVAQYTSTVAPVTASDTAPTARAEPAQSAPPPAATAPEAAAPEAAAAPLPPKTAEAAPEAPMPKKHQHAEEAPEAPMPKKHQNAEEAPEAPMPATEAGQNIIDTADAEAPADPEEIAKTLLQNTAQADRTVAQLFALKASNDLAKRDKDLQEANALELKAGDLRQQAQKVAGDAIQTAEQAAQKVGRRIMEKALDQAGNLESQAKKVEGQAASINAKAKVAMAQAIKAQTSASKAVEDLVTGSSDAKV